MSHPDPIRRYLGAIPNRLQLAGGWIDQPFVLIKYERKVSGGCEWWV